MKISDDLLLGKISVLKHKVLSGKSFPISYKIFGNKKKAIIYYHGWRSNSSVFKFLKNKFKKDYTIIMFDYPSEIITDEPKRTIEYFESILELTKEAIKKSKAKEINLFGTSLGGFLSVYIAKRIKANKLILSVSGTSLADSMWNSLLLKDIKLRLIKKGYSLEKLKAEWKNIEPINNISKAKTLAFTSLNDKIVNYKGQKELAEKMNAKEIREDNLGHYLTAAKNLADYKTVKEFLEK